VVRERHSLASCTRDLAIDERGPEYHAATRREAAASGSC
jgi:hypothetical protein